ncbi:hypothetical protein LLG96_08850, partial [bacterium]|nr:hypothetical protein [bacterium]
MKSTALYIGLFLLFTSFSSAETMTYNKLEQVNLRDRGIPADERSTNILIADGNVVYGATSGDKCHIF